MSFASKRVGGNLLFVDLSPLDNLIKATAHIPKLEVSASCGACVLAVWIIVEIDSFVVHQASPTTVLVRIFCHNFSIQTAELKLLRNSQRSTSSRIE